MMSFNGRITASPGSTDGAEVHEEGVWKNGNKQYQSQTTASVTEQK